MANEMTQYENILSDIRNIINPGRNVAYVAANSASLMTY